MPAGPPLVLMRCPVSCRVEPSHRSTWMSLSPMFCTRIVPAVRREGDALRPAPDPRRGRGHELRAVHPVEQQLAVGVVEGRLARLVAAVHHHHRAQLAVGRQRDALGRLADHHRLHHPERLRLQVDDAHRVVVAVAPPDVRHHRDRAVGADVEPVRAHPRAQVALAVLHLGAVHGENGDEAVAVARHERGPAVAGEGGLARPRLVVPQPHHARGRHRLAVDGEHRHGALGAVGHQRERALPVDRHARRAHPRLERRDHRRRRRAEIHHADAIVGNGLGGVGRILLGRRGHEGEALVRRDRHAHRRADHAAGHRDLRDHLRWRHAEIDDGHGVGRRVGDDLDHPVVENDLVVVRRDRPLGRRAGR